MINTWQEADGWHASIVTGNVVRRTICAEPTEGRAKAQIAFPALPAQEPDTPALKWWQRPFMRLSTGTPREFL